MEDLAPIVIVAMNAEGVHLARRIQAALQPAPRPSSLMTSNPTKPDPQAEPRSFGPTEIHAPRGNEATDVRIFERVTDHLGLMFDAGRALICIMSTGIVIRALGQRLQNKHREPPVICVPQSSEYVIPLLGGHRGANELAQRIAAGLGVTAALSTASAHRLEVALDSPPPGWRMSNPEHYKSFVSSVLDGAPVRLEGTFDWLSSASLPIDDTARLTLREGNGRVSDPGAHVLEYQPRVLAIGMGFERNADPVAAWSLVACSLSQAGWSASAVAAVCTLDSKMDEPALSAVSQALDAPIRLFDARHLDEQSSRVTSPSDLVFQTVGTHSVAEAAALACAGPAATLVITKQVAAGTTLAVALANRPIRVEQAGRAPGRLAVIGIGPGQESWRTPDASLALEAASDLVGYRLYLELAGRPASTAVQWHPYSLGEERDRVRHAIGLAVEGRRVGLVCSGDPGIYAMASLVFEEIELSEDPLWARLPVTIHPGVSALQAAAARSGAPLGHDFCTISLSDLLTPWTIIENRIRAAAEGDFVVTFYNPVSKKRRWQLERAIEILGQHRPPETPVVVARNLGRDGETVLHTQLDALTVDSVDMLSVVTVGSSETRYLNNGVRSVVYTPRGYRGQQSTRAEQGR